MNMSIFKKIFKKTNSHSWIFVIIGYLTISFIFNGKLFWRELIFDQSKIGAVYGEVQAYEWTIEQLYQTLISGHNPFGNSMTMLYPFGLNLGLIDAGYGLIFPILRPFLSTHQSLSILIALALIMANIGMYLLLRKLNFSRTLSFIIGAAYGYMTFLMPRGGHLNYWCQFVFPWFYYFIIFFLTTPKKYLKILAIAGSSLMFVLTLWLNFYYFIMLLISIFSFIFFYIIFDFRLFINKIRDNFAYILLKVIFIFILVFPWLFSLYEMFLFDQIPKTNGWSGAIEFSSDLFNYFLPSGYSHLFAKLPFLMKPFSLFLKLYTPGARSIFENFTYLGVIILFSYFALIFFYKKLNKKAKENIKPFLFVSIVFFILTLGPFLHVFGRWTLPVDGGITIVFPLPYIILHYIPFINSIRVPGRLIVGFIFSAYIVSAYVINSLLGKQKKIIRLFIFLLLFIIFFVDHKYYVNLDVIPKNFYPTSLFQEIKKDKEFSAVLELPFTVRDGLTYFGDISAFQMTVGETFHNKPILGGYTGRIADYKKIYYKNNPLLGYLGRLIDGNLLNNPGLDKTDIESWKNIDLEKSKEAINFLDIKYIISNDSMIYTATLSAILHDLGYKTIKKEKNFSLWSRLVEDKEYLVVNLFDRFSSTYLGFGWYDPENDFRWVDRRSSIMFKVKKPGKYKLNFKASSFYKNQPVTIYLNKEKIQKINLSTNAKEYSVQINTNFEKGINTIYFIFDKYHRPYDVVSGSLDQRRLSGQFYKIWLSN